MIGSNISCNIFSITNGLIICNISSSDYNQTYSIKFVKSIDDNSSKLIQSSTINLTLRIMIGNNYNNLIGYLKYETTSPPSGPNLIFILIILITIFFLSLIACIITTLVCVLCSKSCQKFRKGSQELGTR